MMPDSPTVLAPNGPAVVDLDERDLDRRRVEMREMPRAVIPGGQRLAVALVVEQILVQRLADSLLCRAADLILRRLRVHDAPRLVNRDVLGDAHRAELRIDIDLDKVRAEAVANLAVGVRLDRPTLQERSFRSASPCRRFAS